MVDPGPIRIVGGRDYDAWAVEDDGPSSGEGKARRQSRKVGEYDANEFYVRSTNKHDHSEQTRVRLPGDVLAEMGALVASKAIPEYRTVSDIVRDSLVHRLHYVAEMTLNEDLMYLVQSDMRKSVAERLEREHESNESLVRAWVKRVSTARNNGDKSGLIQARGLIAGDVEWIREPYKKRLKELLDSIETDD